MSQVAEFVMEGRPKVVDYCDGYQSMRLDTADRIEQFYMSSRGLLDTLDPEQRGMLAGASRVRVSVMVEEV